MSEWRSIEVSAFDDGWWEVFPSHPGCYVIYGGNHKPLYIGSSKNMSRRLHEHRREGAYPHSACPKASRNIGQMSRMFVKYKLSQRHGDWLMLEARLIRRLSPPWNVYVGRPRKVAEKTKRDQAPAHSGRYLGKPPTDM